MNNTEKALLELDTLLEFVSESINMLKDDNEDNSDKGSVFISKKAYGIKEMHEKYKTVSTALHNTYTKLMYNDIPQAMHAEGLQSQNIIGIGSVKIKENIRVKVTDTEALHAFMVKKGYDSIIKTEAKIHPQTLKACLKNNFSDVKVNGVEISTSSEAVFSKN